MSSKWHTAIGKEGGLRRWSRVADRTAETAPARAGFMARFEREVDPSGTLDPGTRARMAEAAMRAYMTGLRRKQTTATKPAQGGAA